MQGNKRKIKGGKKKQQEGEREKERERACIGEGDKGGEEGVPSREIV